MTSLSFEIPGPVVPWQRTASYKGRRITPQRQRDYQERVRWCALQARQEQRHPWPMDAQYRVRVDCYRDARRYDGDNALKSVNDAAQGVLWDDDFRVVDGRVVKHVDRKNPRTVVCVEVVE